MAKVVSVKFIETYSNGKQYVYLVPDWVGSINAGDRVIVDSPSNGYVVVEVVNAYDDNTSGIQAKASKATKYIVNKIDDSFYKEALEKEATKKAILVELEKIQKDVEDKIKYEYLRSQNPKAAELLDKLNSL